MGKKGQKTQSWNINDALWCKQDKVHGGVRGLAGGEAGQREEEGAGNHTQIHCALFCKVRSQGQPEDRRRIQCAAAGTTERERDVETFAGCWKDGLGPAF